MENRQTIGHLAALFSILVWGITFISTKVLLTDFLPIEILFFRNVMGLIVLKLLYPRRLTGTDIKQEITFAAAGFCGICLYYLLENIALTYTLASNVGIIVSVAPFFTALVATVIARMKQNYDEKIGISFVVGFVLAMGGILLTSLNGNTMEVHPFGDFLAVMAALVWGFYSNIMKRITTYGYHTIQTTRRIFFYGILFMIPTLPFFHFQMKLERFSNPIYLFNIVFLGIGASALCFVTWNYAVAVLGVIKTSVYIYLTPFIAVVASYLILKEQITGAMLIGMFFIILGLVISEDNPFERLKRKR